MFLFLSPSRKGEYDEGYMQRGKSDDEQCKKSDHQIDEVRHRKRALKEDMEDDGRERNILMIGCRRN